MQEPPQSPESTPAAPAELPKSSPERRFVQRHIVQPFIQWMPLGGSGGLFLSFLLQQNWALALLTFPATIVTAVWAAYSQNFVERLSEIYAEKGKRDADALNNWLTSLNEAIKWQLAGVNAKYCRRQASDCESYRSEGIAQQDRIFTPMLKEVFIPLRLDGNPLSPGLRQKVFERFEQDQGTTDIWEILAGSKREPMLRQLAILAWGGYGKTTLLKHIAYRYGCNQQPRSAPKLIPVLLILRKYRHLLSQPNPPSLPDLIIQHHIPSLPGDSPLNVPSYWASDLLKRGQALVMLDGFDEVARDQRPAVARWLTQQMRLYGKSTFIVTSRPKAYKEQPAADRLDMATSFWVQDFDETQRKDFVEKWYLTQEQRSAMRDTDEVRKVAAESATELLNQIEARPELKDLAKNPLLLNMIASFHRRFPGADLPKRRVNLYGEICRLQLKDRPEARKLDTLLTRCDAQTILQMLALDMMRNRWERIDREPLLQYLKIYLQQQRETIAAKDFLDQVVQISELLVEREPEEFEFTHLSFQEYLAATQIREHQPETVLYDYIYDDWWKPTILLYVAQVKVPAPLIRTVMERGNPDFAYLCLQETTRLVDAALKQALLQARLTRLEEYLQNHQWKEADRETYRLMITTVGKEEGQWFYPEDLLNFPCEELRAIDGLWVKYSKGLFGFSVQKEIYCQIPGVKLDGRYPGDKAWEQFGDTVGWHKNGKWLSYDQLEPSFSSPQGIFPAAVALGWVGGVFCFSSLAQRLVNCSTSQF